MKRTIIAVAFLAASVAHAEQDNIKQMLSLIDDEAQRADIAELTHFRDSCYRLGACYSYQNKLRQLRQKVEAGEYKTPQNVQKLTRPRPKMQNAQDEF